MSGYNSDEDLLSGPQRDLSGFLVPENSSEFTSHESASSQKKRPPCIHGLRKDTCKTCWHQYNADRVSKGLEPEARGIFCKHGINKFTIHPCMNPECMEKRKKNVEYVGESLFQQPSGVIPDSARMFYPSIPNSAGLSFSELKAYEVKPTNKKLFHDDEEIDNRGGKVSRKAHKKTVRKVKTKKSRRRSYGKSKRPFKK
jgi:hypothetical protein